MMLALLSKYGARLVPNLQDWFSSNFLKTFILGQNWFESYLEQLKLPRFDKKYNLHFFSKLWCL